MLNACAVNTVPENIRASFSALSQVSRAVPCATAESVFGLLWFDNYAKVLPFFLCAALYVAATLMFYFHFGGIQKHSDLTTSPRQSKKIV